MNSQKQVFLMDNSWKTVFSGVDVKVPQGVLGSGRESLFRLAAFRDISTKLCPQASDFWN